MSQNNSGNSLLIIRKFIQENYGDIKCILKLSPLAYNN